MAPAGGGAPTDKQLRARSLATPSHNAFSTVMSAPVLDANAVTRDHTAPDAWLADAATTFEQVADALDADQRRLVERFLAPGAPVASSERLLCHNDLGVEHLLVTPDRGTLTGVIDWADVARPDPAVDLGRLYRDLGPGTVELIADLLGSDRGTAAVRARFYACCTLLEDLHRGLETGDHRYSNAALQNLARTYDAGAIDERP